MKRHLRKLFLRLWARYGLTPRQRRAFAHWQRIALQSETPVALSATDRGQWRTFLASPAGQKLVAYLQHQEAAQNQAATGDYQDNRRACGQAQGYRLCVSQLFSLTETDSPDESDTQHIQQLVEEAGLEHLLN